MARTLNPTILRDTLPPSVEAIMGQVEENVNRAVNQVVEEFKSQAEAHLQAFREGRYPAELQATLDKEVAEATKEIDATVSIVKDVKAKAENLAMKLKKMDGDQKDLQSSVNELVNTAQSLNTMVNQTRDKVKGFGKTSGAAIANTAYKFFTGGIA